MKQITITSNDYAEAAAKATAKLMKSFEEEGATKEMFGTMLLEFLVFQNAIFNELFKEEGENYA